MMLVVGLAVIAAAVVAILYRVDVRLALLLAALALGALAGNVPAVARKFFITLTSEEFVVPICCAMGFAYVLRLTQCDRHLVHLLVGPLRRVRPLLVPGAVVVGFVINIPVISQTSTAVAIGSVLVPVLRAARVSAVTTGAALLLGCSIGGELLNPAAPEFRTVADAVHVEATRCVEAVFPLIVPHLVVATAAFWLFSARADAGRRDADDSAAKHEPLPAFRVNLIKALVPLLPVTLLFLTGPPLQWIIVPPGWLTDVTNAADRGRFGSRLIGAAMLVGVVAAALTGGRRALDTASAFFEGAGHAFMSIISVIVAAGCFGEGVRQLGLADALGDVIRARPGLLLPTAAGLPLGFAWVSGSGMASTNSLFAFFVAPAHDVGVDPVRVGAVVSVVSAAGRTMSPVAAVALMCAALSDTDPVALIRRLALPLLLGVATVLLVAMSRG